MPTILEHSPFVADELDQFINWEPSFSTVPDVTAPDFSSYEAGMDGMAVNVPLEDDCIDNGFREDMILENAAADDLSFWALENYAQANIGAAAEDNTDTAVAGESVPALTALDAAGPGFGIHETNLDDVAVNVSLAEDLTNNVFRENLMFESSAADDLSFWALEHFTQTNTTGTDTDAKNGTEAPLDKGASLVSSSSLDNQFYQPDMSYEPCSNCKEGGFQCKTIREGNYKGYCTSCVARRRECSLGLYLGGPVPTDISFPPNPWPTLGDHPLRLHEEDALTATVGATAASSLAHSASAPDFQQLFTPSSPKDSKAAATIPAPTASKSGPRLSRESVRILKNWVSTHSRHPYPTEEEKESLQRLTGLNKTQISNWLANARRRGKIPTTRSTSPHVRSSYAGLGMEIGAGAGAIDIPQPRRSGTPSPFDRRPFQTDNILLQRWADSPPENEPASVTDIARAITSSSSMVSSGLNSPFSSHHFTDDGSGRSLFNGSSASSVGTSHSSGGSFASAFSHASRGSFASSFGSHARGRRRRRRRQEQGSLSFEGEADLIGKKFSRRKSASFIGNGDGLAGLLPSKDPLRTYQCTFCTETFKTKHDWQRHEKSLHLSLERWVCAPSGAVAVHPDTKVATCVFCNHKNPDEAHLETHNYDECQERAVADRTFYRKDHLRQHLKLVHRVKFQDWAMEKWKVATPEIRSRCGFCGIVMDTWTFRIDHLAEHFKTGQTMADWKGDWGFDDPILKIVENSIPPYLIHNQRTSPLSYTTSMEAVGPPQNNYDANLPGMNYPIG